VNREAIVEYFNHAAEAMTKMENQQEIILKVTREIATAIENGRKILVCGNGGSASDAQHFAAELVGRFEKDRSPYAAIALNTDTSIITAIANDYGYSEIYSKQIQALGKPGDVLIGISTSGSSKNINRAVEVAKEIGLLTVALTGQRGELGDNCDYAIRSPSHRTCHVQETHIATLQLVAQLIEDHFA
jgi:D-sedoheptulose 7-phosphate isomerase